MAKMEDFTKQVETNLKELEAKEQKLKKELEEIKTEKAPLLAYLKTAGVIKSNPNMGRPKKEGGDGKEKV